MLGCLGALVLLPATLLALQGMTGAGETLPDAPLQPVPAMALPGLLEPRTDPVFGTPFTRVTDPGRDLLPGVPCAAEHCRHRYSSAQAWNADQSLLVIAKGCPGLCFLDGQTYRPLFQRRPSGACEWHPVDPAEMICVSESEIYRWSVRSDTHATVFAPEDYSGLSFGPGKGNLSNDGDRLVVLATDRAGAAVAFAYDLQSGTKHPDIRLDDLAGRTSYCSISPSGHYVFCFQAMTDKTHTAYVFSVDGDRLQHWTENHRPGHGDMTIDEDGSDVYVGISKAPPDKFRVIKRRLADGAVTALTPRAPVSHVSARNIARPGWVFLTYAGSYSRAASGRKVGPLYREIVALRIDGSGEVRRIAHTRSEKDGYWSEAHASPSPDGSQVIWASNWGRADAPVAAYVARLSWPEEPDLN